MRFLGKMILLWAAAGPVCFFSGVVKAGGDIRKKHVVVVVFDGLRPDSVNAVDTPVLWDLGRRGVVFAHHHPVYFSSTEVNGSAMVTGAMPNHTGIMANREYRPGIELTRPVEMQNEGVVRKGDEGLASNYLGMPTLAEMVEEAGGRSVVAGTKPVALLLDRAERESSEQGANVYEGNVQPRSMGVGLMDAEGDFPVKADQTKSANEVQDKWTTLVLVNRLWGGEVPAFSMLWLSEPDYAQHGTGLGSEVAKAALRSSDANLGRVLKGLEGAGVLETTDVMVVSDHGFSTIERNVDLVRELKKGGFRASEEWENPKTGDVLVVGNGGSVCLYVAGHDDGVTGKLVHFLQETEYAGVIFTKKGIAGTFELGMAHIDTAEAPDVVMSMRWKDKEGANGIPGLIDSVDWKKKAWLANAGQGNHTSLSVYDMHNTLIAVGPDFKKGIVDELPSGNVDIAPTVLRILGIVAQKKMDGRVLGEAMVGGGMVEGGVTKTVWAESDLAKGRWREYLKISQVGGVSYLDEGNGG